MNKGEESINDMPFTVKACLSVRVCSLPCLLAKEKRICLTRVHQLNEYDSIGGKEQTSFLRISCILESKSPVSVPRARDTLRFRDGLRFYYKLKSQVITIEIGADPRIPEG